MTSVAAAVQETRPGAACTDNHRGDESEEKENQLPSLEQEGWPKAGVVEKVNYDGADHFASESGRKKGLSNFESPRGVCTAGEPRVCHAAGTRSVFGSSLVSSGFL